MNLNSTEKLLLLPKNVTDKLVEQKQENKKHFEKYFKRKYSESFSFATHFIF